MIELLVVIAIIGVLVALLLPSIHAARGAARRMTCASNLKQLGIAMQSYHEGHRRLPPGYIFRSGPEGNQAGFGWGSFLLHYVEQSPVADLIDWRAPIYDPINQTAREQHLAAFICPSDLISSAGFVEMGTERYGMASYVASFGPPDLDDTQEKRDGVFSRNSDTRIADISDGTTNTLAVGERQNGPFRGKTGHGVHFTYETTWAGAVREITDPTDDHGHMVLFQTGHTPNHEDSDDRDVSAPHEGFANFLMCDGSIRVIKAAIELEIYTALGTKAGGDMVGDN